MQLLSIIYLSKESIDMKIFIVLIFTMLSTMSNAEKFALLNIEEAIQKTTVYSDASKRLMESKLFTQSMEELNQIKIQLDTKAKSITMSQPPMSQEERKSARAEYDKLVAEFNVLQQQLKKEHDSALVGIRNNVMKGFEKAVKDIINIKNIEVVFRQQGVLFARPHIDMTNLKGFIDITEDVTNSLNHATKK